LFHSDPIADKVKIIPKRIVEEGIFLQLIIVFQGSMLSLNLAPKAINLVCINN
jgi:hypothetical protein